jgi:hypothetical protein
MRRNHHRFLIKIKMKKQILTILTLFAFLFVIANVSATERTLFLDDYEMEYSYFGAEEDESFTLFVTIKNTGNENKTEVLFEINDDDPFSVKDDEEWEIDTLDVGEERSTSFRIEVDSNTPQGEYKLEFTLEDDDDDFEDDMEIEVESDKADLIIGNVATMPSTIGPDLEDIKLDVTIENLGSGDATFVRAKLILPNGFESSSSFSDFVNLGTIFGENNGDDDNDLNKVATFYIDSDETLNSGVHVAKLELEYKSDIEKITQILNFDLPVKGKPLFSIISSSTTPTKVMQGDVGKLNIQIENTGEEEGVETSIRVFENSDLPIEFNQKTNFIGNLKEGENGMAVFEFEVDSDATPKEYLIKVQTRTLNNNNVLVSEYSVPLKILESERNNSVMIYIIITLILVIVLVILYVMKRNKNQKEMKNSKK